MRFFFFSCQTGISIFMRADIFQTALRGSGRSAFLLCSCFCTYITLFVEWSPTLLTSMILYVTHRSKCKKVRQKETIHTLSHVPLSFLHLREDGHKIADEICWGYKLITILCYTGILSMFRSTGCGGWLVCRNF